MSRHRANLNWERTTAGFDYSEYNRDHDWAFPGGARLEASAAPEFGGNGTRLDPEQAFVASVAACHMLTFLAICARKRLVVDRYEDRAVGFLEKNEDGQLAIIRVELSPEIVFADEAPGPDQVRRIHELSHQECFIANSVRTEVIVLSSKGQEAGE